ncbi:recombinase family protein [Alloscardovia criceti]|uniref:recombinase family protein n=1 Tax=Alloscardovia criceti TaxID=356828 RepID=UPI001B7FCBD5
MPYSNFLGYRKGPDGQPEIDPGQTKVVRRIYADFLTGHSPKTIAKTLTLEGVPTPRASACGPPRPFGRS